MENPFEIVPANVSRNDLIDESNRRMAKCGISTRDGHPPNRTKIMAAPPNEQYRKNYDKITW